MSEEWKSVLVLEDGPLILMMMENALTDAQFDVHGVATDQEAIHLLSSTVYHVAVIDFQLQSGNSLSVADGLLRRSIPFIFSTAASFGIPAEFAAVPVLQKPFSDGDLISAVAQLASPR